MDDTQQGTQGAQQDAQSDTHTTYDQNLGQILHQYTNTNHDPMDDPDDDDEEDDRDSAMGSDGFPSETGTIAPEVTAYRWEYGRRWASESWPPTEHYFPNDDNEIDRYGLINDMTYLALGERRYTARLDRQNVHHVLDVGCGKPIAMRSLFTSDISGAGHWCINMADSHSGMQIHGVDLFPIQPTNVPMNCRCTSSQLNRSQ